MKGRSIAAWRLRNQRLSSAPLRSAEDVLRHLGAIQSQEYEVAKWSFGVRARGLTADVLERLFAAGSILRTHVLRPTWHFVLPTDIRWMLALTGPRILAMSACHYRRLELAERLFARTNDLIADALAGGRHRTRAELQAVLEADGIVAAGQRLGAIVMRAELDAVVCSGAMKGRQHTYALLDERVPSASGFVGDEALAELARRYFTSHGPATPHDFARWSSLTVKEARASIEMLGDALTPVRVGDRTYWRAGGTPPPARRPAPAAWLLQGYDEYIVAHSDSRRIFDQAGALPSGPTARPPLTHAVVLGTQLVGHWRRTWKGEALLVEVQPLMRLDDSQRGAIRVAAERYAAFVAAQELSMEVLQK